MTQYSEEPEERWETGGEQFLIRPIRPADAAEHDAFFHRLSPEDIRLRFFAAVRELTPAQLDKFTRLDYDRDMALIAVREETGQTVGVPRHGVREVIGEILAENAAMIDLARHLGFSLLHLPEDRQIVKVRLSLAPPGP